MTVYDITLQSATTNSSIAKSEVVMPSWCQTRFNPLDGKWRRASLFEVRLRDELQVRDAVYLQVQRLHGPIQRDVQHDLREPQAFVSGHSRVHRCFHEWRKGSGDTSPLRCAGAENGNSRRQILVSSRNAVKAPL